MIDQDWTCPFDSTEKDRVRDMWYKYSEQLYQHLGTKLKFLWLADDSLADLKNVVDIAESIFVPEHQNDHKIRKEIALRALPREAASIIKLPTVGRLHLKDALALDTYDVINYDACSHFHSGVLNTLIAMFKQPAILNGGLLFMTLADHSQAAMHKQYRALTHDMSAEVCMITNCAESYGWVLKCLPNLPTRYRSNSNRTEMHSYGWQVSRLT
jgi:hypothetical protein